MDRKSNVHYRPAKKDTCITCRNRIFVNLSDPEGRILGQDFRCPVIGIEYPISGSHTCDKHRAIRPVSFVIDPGRLQW